MSTYCKPRVQAQSASMQVVEFPKLRVKVYSQLCIYIHNYSLQRAYMYVVDLFDNHNILEQGRSDPLL
jgi:hypothetical protein